MKRIKLFFAIMSISALFNGFAFAQDTTLTVTSTGNVGIGITTPTRKLDVDGEGGFTGNLNGKKTTKNTMNTTANKAIQPGRDKKRRAC